MSNVPKLRFPGFEGEWEPHTLNNILYVRNERNIQNNFKREDVLSVTRDHGIVNQIAYFGASHAGSDLKNYYIVNNNDIVYTKSPLRYNPYGIIKGNRDKPGIVSVLYAVYGVQINFSPIFLDYYFGLDDHINSYLRPLVNKGAKNVLAINNNEMLTGHIFVPEHKEQIKIAEYFSMIDARIKLYQKKISEIEKQKRWITHCIFTQKLRFKADDGNDYPVWQSTRLSDILSETKAKNRENLNICSVAVYSGVVDQIKHMGRSFAAKQTTHYNRVNPGDLIYTKSPTGEFPYGIVKQSLLKEPVAVSPLYGVFKPKSKELGHLIHNCFLYKTKANNYLAPLAQKGAKNTINITNQRFLENAISLPTCISEQTKIANFFSLYDRKLEKEKAKLEALREQKKGLLQQMFV